MSGTAQSGFDITYRSDVKLKNENVLVSRENRSQITYTVHVLQLTMNNNLKKEKKRRKK